MLIQGSSLGTVIELLLQRVQLVCLGQRHAWETLAAGRDDDGVMGGDEASLDGDIGGIAGRLAADMGKLLGLF
jgi:hypothetical protein